MFSSPQVIVLKAFLGRGQAHFIGSADPFKVQKDWAKGHLHITGLLLQLQPKRGWRQQGWRSLPQGKITLTKWLKNGEGKSLQVWHLCSSRAEMTLTPWTNIKTIHPHKGCPWRAFAGKNSPPNGKKKKSFYYKMIVTTQLWVFCPEPRRHFLHPCLSTPP